jgi:serine/threonine protein phosphatase PrpC
MIRTFTFTEAGGHPVNEDAFLIEPIPDGIGGYVVAVADGQGGRARAAEAARLACRTVVDAALRRGAGFDKSGCREVLAKADRAVTHDDEAGFTTLVAFTVRWNSVVGASCGDSAVLAVCGSGAVSELTRLQYKNPPVGSGEATFVPFAADLVRPWMVLAMTDGVWKYVGWERVRELAAKLSGEELIGALKAAARLPGSGQFQDDFTVVLVEAE